MKITPATLMYAELLIEGKQDDFMAHLDEQYQISSWRYMKDGDAATVMVVDKHGHNFAIEVGDYLILDYDWDVVEVCKGSHFEIKYNMGWS